MQLASDRLQSSTLHRSLRSLAHPLTIAAVIVLLLNDHVLRVLWPSWITGKLGDAAWLAFAPLMLALPLALIFPHRDRRVIWLSIGITGWVFATMKTSPAAMQFGLSMLEGIVGYPMVLRVDPTDLLTLPALAISAWVWQREDHPPVAARGWVVLSLAALASIANTYVPSPNANCLIIDDTGVIVSTESYFSEYLLVSGDGGITWDEVPKEQFEAKLEQKCANRRYRKQWELSDPNNPQIVYRFTGGIIERSQDGGSTWSLEKDVRLSEAQLAYYNNVKNFQQVSAGPVDAVLHPDSGNLIVAMGFEGLFIRTADGRWHWETSQFAIAGAHRVSMFNPLVLLQLIWIELVLAGMATLLFVGTISLLTNRNNASTLLRWLGVPVAWGLWYLPVSRHPAMVWPDIGVGIFMTYVFPVIILIEIIWAVLAFREIRYQYRGIPSEIVKGAAAVFVGFSLPFIFWGWGLFPTYDLAITISLAVFALILLFTGWTVRKKYLS